MLLRIVQWQRVHSAHRDLDAVTARIYLCYMYGATNVAPSLKDRLLPPSKRKPHFANTYMSRMKRNLGQKSRRDLKPRMTMLARTSSSLTDRPYFSQTSCVTDDCRELVVSQWRESVWSWQLEEMVASLRGLEPGSRGTSAIGSRCQATLVETVKSSLCYSEL
jgi:hypothetical protein